MTERFPFGPSTRPEPPPLSLVNSTSLQIGPEQSRALEINLFAGSAEALNTLEGQWRAAFSGFRGLAGGENITSWLESSYDEMDDERATDSSARIFRRTVDHKVSFVPASP